MVECLTDNKKRTAPAVRHLFSKCNGEMGSDGAVKWMFERAGFIAVNATEDQEDELMEAVLEAADDKFDLVFELDEDEEEGTSTPVAVISCEPTNLAVMKNAVAEGGFEMREADIVYNPTQYVPVAGEDDLALLQKFFGLLDNDDDVQRYFHNAQVEE